MAKSKKSKATRAKKVQRRVQKLKQEKKEKLNRDLAGIRKEKEVLQSVTSKSSKLKTTLDRMQERLSSMNPKTEKDKELIARQNAELADMRESLELSCSMADMAVESIETVEMLASLNEEDDLPNIDFPLEGDVANLDINDTINDIATRLTSANDVANNLEDKLDGEEKEKSEQADVTHPEETTCFGADSKLNHKTYK